MKWAGHVVRMGQKKNSYRILFAKPDGMRLLARVEKLRGLNPRANCTDRAAAAGWRS
jgi:hypothetical protein